MLLGFISLLLMVFQGVISKICVKEHLLLHMLPRSLDSKAEAEKGEHKKVTATEHFQKFLAFPYAGKTRWLVADHAATEAGYCSHKGKVPLLSLEALHHLHIFIFALAISHVTFCVLTVVFGITRIHQWKMWEDAISDENFDPEKARSRGKVTDVRKHAFIREHFLVLVKTRSSLDGLYPFSSNLMVL